MFNITCLIYIKSVSESVMLSVNSITIEFDQSTPLEEITTVSDDN